MMRPPHDLAVSRRKSGELPGLGLQQLGGGGCLEEPHFRLAEAEVSRHRQAEPWRPHQEISHSPWAKLSRVHVCGTAR